MLGGPWLKWTGIIIFLIHRWWAKSFRENKLVQLSLGSVLRLLKNNSVAAEREGERETSWKYRRFFRKMPSYFSELSLRTLQYSTLRLQLHFYRQLSFFPAAGCRLPSSFCLFPSSFCLFQSSSLSFSTQVSFFRADGCRLRSSFCRLRSSFCLFPSSCLLFYKQLPVVFQAALCCFSSGCLMVFKQLPVVFQTAFFLQLCLFPRSCLLFSMQMPVIFNAVSFFTCSCLLFFMWRAVVFQISSGRSVVQYSSQLFCCTVFQSAVLLYSIPVSCSAVFKQQPCGCLLNFRQLLSCFLSSCLCSTQFLCCIPGSWSVVF